MKQNKNLLYDFDMKLKSSFIQQSREFAIIFIAPGQFHSHLCKQFRLLSVEVWFCCSFF